MAAIIMILNKQKLFMNSNDYSSPTSSNNQFGQGLGRGGAGICRDLQELLLGWLNCSHMAIRGRTQQGNLQRTKAHAVVCIVFIYYG